MHTKLFQPGNFNTRSLALVDTHFWRAWWCTKWRDCLSLRSAITCCTSWLVCVIARKGITADRLPFGPGNQRWQPIFQCYKASDASITPCTRVNTFYSINSYEIFLVYVYIFRVLKILVEVYFVWFRTTMILTKFI